MVPEAKKRQLPIKKAQFAGAARLFPNIPEILPTVKKIDPTKFIHELQKLNFLGRNIHAVFTHTSRQPPTTKNTLPVVNDDGTMAGEEEETPIAKQPTLYNNDPTI